jgi:hypothetical protein
LKVPDAVSGVDTLETKSKEYGARHT